MSKEALAELAKDGSIGGAALTAPYWLQYLEFWIQHVAIFLGLALLLMRLALAVREWLQKPEAD